MSSYNELIKNFQRVRAYMRDFYVYGFKSRDDYDRKSPRSYDDERRRLESWLGDHMSFVRSAEGKNMFISIDSRETVHNPLYKAWKSKSFTDKDITLHFIIFDILSDKNASFSVREIMEKICDEYLSFFETDSSFDISTLRKKLKEYELLGLLKSEKKDKKVFYRREKDIFLWGTGDSLNFFSESLPCGVVGSFLLDRTEENESVFGFKHHYITSTLDSDILATLFSAMRARSFVTVKKTSRGNEQPKAIKLVPLKIFISVQNGRQHLLAYNYEFNQIKSFRVDYLSDAEISDECPNFCELRALLEEKQKYMWGVTCKNGNHSQNTETVEFTVFVPQGEEHILRRLEREKRNGTVEQIDDCRYRFRTEVFDTSELIPWIRTFICRIEQLNFSNRTVENQFKQDINEMYRLYDIDGGDTL